MNKSAPVSLAVSSTWKLIVPANPARVGLLITTDGQDNIYLSNQSVDNTTNVIHVPKATQNLDLDLHRHGSFIQGDIYGKSPAGVGVLVGYLEVICPCQDPPHPR